IAAGSLYVVGLSHSIWGVFLVLCSPLPIYIASLSFNSLASGIAGVIAVAGVMAFSDPLLASVFSIAFVLPAFLLGHIATQQVGKTQHGDPIYRSAADMTQMLLILGVFIVTISALAVSLTPAGLVGSIRSNLNLLMNDFYGADASHGPDAVTNLADIVDLWDSLVLGMIVAVVVASHAAMGALGQGLARSGGKAQRPAPAFWRLRLPGWPSYLTLLLGVAVMGLDTLSGDREGTIAFVIYLLTGFLLVLGVGFCYRVSRSCMRSRAAWARSPLYWRAAIL
ncbi:MAG: DUF2232 domain-containing protein, partial [Alphaproteobacteria bacterium]